MKLKDFAIERYFAKYEFKVKYLLSSSDCDGFPMKYVLDLASNDEIRKWENLKLGYTETSGSPELREAISRHYQTIGPDNIIVSSPGEAIFALMNICLEKDDEIICMSPAYESLYEIAQSIGCKISFWQTDFQSNWYYDPSKLEALVSDRTKMIIVNFPHNPTGYYPGNEDWEMIIEIARKYGLLLFSDEMYRFLTYDNRNLQSASDLYQNAVSLWGMAKTFGLAGLRIGWLASKNIKVIKKVEAYKDYLTMCNSATSEVLSTIALNNIDKFVQSNLEKIKSNILVFDEFQKRNSSIIEFPKPKAGSTAFIKLNINKPAMEYAEKLVRDTGIMLLPSEIFNYGTQHARIGFGRKNLPEILELYEEYINK